ncbi:MAG: MerR family transcriptional regulator [Pseudomonadota bacterium]
MQISEAAKKTGLSVSAIRFYERRSIVRRPRREGRNRDYSDEDLRALHFVRRARALGMPLRDIAGILHRPWAEGEMAGKVSEHRQTIQAQIEALRRMDDALSRLETCKCHGVHDCELANGDD